MDLWVHGASVFTDAQNNTPQINSEKDLLLRSEQLSLLRVCKESVILMSLPTPSPSRTGGGWRRQARFQLRRSPALPHVRQVLGPGLRAQPMPSSLPEATGTFKAVLGGEHLRCVCWESRLLHTVGMGIQSIPSLTLE